MRLLQILWDVEMTLEQAQSHLRLLQILWEIEMTLE